METVVSVYTRAKPKGIAGAEYNDSALATAVLEDGEEVVVSREVWRSSDRARVGTAVDAENICP